MPLFLLGFFFFHQGEVGERIRPTFIHAASSFSLPLSRYTHLVAGDEVRIARAIACTRTALVLAVTLCARRTLTTAAIVASTSTSPVHVLVLPVMGVLGGARQDHVKGGAREWGGGGGNGRGYRGGKGNYRTPIHFLTGVGGRKGRRRDQRSLLDRIPRVHVPHGSRWRRFERNGMRARWQIRRVRSGRKRSGWGRV